MTIAELLKDFNCKSAEVDMVELTTVDIDFGGVVTLDILSISEPLSLSHNVSYRIAIVRDWWIKKSVSTSLHPGPWDLELRLVIQI